MKVAFRAVAKGGIGGVLHPPNNCSFLVNKTCVGTWETFVGTRETFVGTQEAFVGTQDPIHPPNIFL